MKEALLRREGMGVELKRGDCLEVMDGLEDNSVDLVLTDPPYSSGGLFAGDRKSRTSSKYTDRDYNGAARLPDFSGDNMDQRSFTGFMRMALAKCRRATKPGGVCMAFVDWRNLPAMTDALQMAGWVYRGIVVWDKGASRPTPDRFRNDCEYVVWGTDGQRKAEYKKGVFVGKGCFKIPSVPSKNKSHQTEKPVELLKNLMGICPENGTVLDCFMGSGSTGVACVETDRDFIGIELLEEYFNTAQRRIGEAMNVKRQ